MSESQNENGTYCIMRFHFDNNHPDHRKVILVGLTLEEAQSHCQKESTREEDESGRVVWFDGYTAE